MTPESESQMSVNRLLPVPRIAFPLRLLLVRNANSWQLLRRRNYSPPPLPSVYRRFRSVRTSDPSPVQM